MHCCRNLAREYGPIYEKLLQFMDKIFENLLLEIMDKIFENLLLEITYKNNILTL